MEHATERLWVRASPEVVEELLAGWSRDVRLRAERRDDGELELVVQEVTSASETSGA